MTSSRPDPVAPGRLPSDYVPVPTARTPSYRLPAISAAVARRRPVHGLRCTRGGAGRAVYGAHLELYARGLVVPVAAGIGIAPPQRRDGAYVRGGACLYPVRTYEPTGLIVIERGTRTTLGALFALWGQPLGRSRLAGFHGTVRAYIGGARWRGNPAQIPLTRHAEIVLEVGPLLPPHRRYLFPAGL